MKDPYHIPPLDPALIEALENRYPDRCPSLEDTDRQVWFKAGQAAVVAMLRRELQAQQDNILERKL